MMKRTISFVLTLAAASIAFVSCEKPAEKEEPNEIVFNPIGGQEEDGPGTGSGNGDVKETGTVIKLDGDFSDWAQDGVVSTTNFNASYPAICEMKACMSSKYLYVYYKSTALDQLHNVRLVLDCDNNAETGDKYTYLTGGYSLMFNMVSAATPSNAGVYTLILGGDSYVAELSGCVAGKSVVNEAEKTIEVEMSVSRADIEKDFPFTADKVALAMYALSPSWALSAIIPNGSALLVNVEK